MVSADTDMVARVFHFFDSFEMVLVRLLVFLIFLVGLYQVGRHFLKHLHLRRKPKAQNQ